LPTLAIDIEARLASFEAGIAKIGQTTSGLASKLEGAFGGLQTALGALSGVLVGGSLAAMVRSFADAGDQLNKLSQKTGVAVEALSELQYAAKLSDVSNEELGKGLSKLRLEIEQAAAGSKDAVAAFKAIGISQRDLATLSVDQIFARLADEFANGRAGAAELAKILGDRNWSTFAPLLNAGAKGLADMGAEARRLGVVINGETARAAEAFNDNLTRLSTQLQGIGYALAGPVVSGLSQIAERMVEASRQGGILLGVLRGIGEVGKIALQGGIDASAVQKQRAYINEIRGEILKLERSASGNGAFGSGLLDRLIYGDGAEKARKLAELKVTLADAEKALKNIQQSNAPAASAPVERKIAQAADPKTKATRSDALTDAERAQLAIQQASDREFERFLDQVAQKRAEQARDFETILQEGPLEAAKQAAELDQRLKTLLAGTRGGQQNALADDLKVVNDAFKAGKINAEQLSQAYDELRKRADRIDGKPLANLTKEADEGFRRLQASIERWGDATAEEIVKVVQTGKLNFSSLISTIGADLLRLTVQQSITRPVFGALAAALSGGGSAGAPTAAGTPFGFSYGGGRAAGGNVSGGRFYTVGERGPETLFVNPGQSGTIVPNGGGAAPVNVYLDARTDSNLVRQYVLQAVSLAQSEQARRANMGA
jgi:hypothetical protein